MLWVSQGQQAWAEGDIRTYPVPDGGYEAARDALIEVIEAEGLVVGAVLPFNQMLQRTGGQERRVSVRERRNRTVLQ